MKARALAALVVVFLAARALAWTPDPEQRRVDLPPDRTGPVPVLVDFFLLNVTEINGATETFGASLYIDLKWKDPRMAFDAEAFGANRVIFPKDSAATQLAQMWSPHVDAENMLGEAETLDATLTIFADGTVEYERRLSGTFASPMMLNRFPLDEQTLHVKLESFLWDSKEVQLISSPPKDRPSHVNEALSIRGWSLLSVNMQTTEHTYITGDRYSQLLSTMQVKREPWFYIWAVIFPLVLVTFFALTCLFWDQETLSERAAQVLTCLLTVTAQNLAVSGDLPKISYFTPIDFAFLLTYAVLLVVVIESIVVKIINEKDAPGADRVDRLTLWISAALYTIGMVAIFFLG